MTREEFDGWMRDPVTLWVFGAVARAAEQEREEWIRQSWDEGNIDPMQLCELRTRANALTELRENGFETWQTWNGEHDDEDD